MKKDNNINFMFQSLAKNKIIIGLLIDGVRIDI